MKKSRLLIAAGAILVISITIIAAISHIPRERIIADPTALFNEVLLTENADNGAYSITAIETVSVGNETYICETQTTVNIYGRETDAPTLFQVNGPVGLESWKDYCHDLSGSAIAGELSSNDFALMDGDKMA